MPVVPASVPGLHSGAIDPSGVKIESASTLPGIRQVSHEFVEPHDPPGRSATNAAPAKKRGGLLSRLRPSSK
jgi:hypothetical protein